MGAPAKRFIPSHIGSTKKRQKIRTHSNLLTNKLALYSISSDLNYSSMRVQWRHRALVQQQEEDASTVAISSAMQVAA
jgi:hypothetical protein